MQQAPGHDPTFEVGEASCPRRLLPLVHRRQRLARVLGVGESLVPVDAGHRVVASTFRVLLVAPLSWPGKTTAILQEIHGFVERQLHPVLDERFAPVRRVRVAAGPDELLILLVAHLELVDEEVVEGNDIHSADSRATELVVRAGHEDHAVGHRSNGRQALFEHDVR